MSKYSNGYSTPRNRCLISSGGAGYAVTSGATASYLPYSSSFFDNQTVRDAEARIAARRHHTNTSTSTARHHDTLLHGHHRTSSHRLREHMLESRKERHHQHLNGGRYNVPRATSPAALPLVTESSHSTMSGYSSSCTKNTRPATNNTQLELDSATISKIKDDLVRTEEQASVPDTSASLTQSQLNECLQEEDDNNLQGINRVEFLSKTSKNEISEEMNGNDHKSDSLNGDELDCNELSATNGSSSNTECVSPSSSSRCSDNITSSGRSVLTNTDGNVEEPITGSTVGVDTVVGGPVAGSTPVAPSLQVVSRRRQVSVSMESEDLSVASSSSTTTATLSTAHSANGGSLSPGNDNCVALKLQVKALREELKESRSCRESVEFSNSTLSYQVENLKDENEDIEERSKLLFSELRMKSRKLTLSEQDLRQAQSSVRLLQAQLDEQNALIAERGLVLVGVEDESSSDDDHLDNPESEHSRTTIDNNGGISSVASKSRNNAESSSNLTKNVPAFIKFEDLEVIQEEEAGTRDATSVYINCDKQDKDEDIERKGQKLKTKVKRIHYKDTENDSSTTYSSKAIVSTETASILSDIKGASLDAKIKRLAQEKDDYSDTIRRLQLDVEELKSINASCSTSTSNRRRKSSSSPKKDDSNLKNDDQSNLTDSDKHGEGEGDCGDTEEDIEEWEKDKLLDDYKFKMQKCEQDISNLQATVCRLQSQVERFRSSADIAEHSEQELKTEKRKMQRQIRDSESRIDELETANKHLATRLSKLKNVKSTLLKDLHQQDNS